MADSSSSTTTPPTPQGMYGVAQVVVGDRGGFFQGQCWKDYTLVQDGDLHLVADFQPVFATTDPTRCMHRVAGTLPAGTYIEINEQGLVRIETPGGYKFDFWRHAAYESTLNQKAYLETFATDTTFPSSFGSATGLLPQFDGTNGESFLSTTSPVGPVMTSPAPTGT